MKKRILNFQFSTNAAPRHNPFKCHLRTSALGLQFILFLCAGLALSACHSNRQNSMYDDNESVEIYGTDSTGMYSIYGYEGIVPGENGKPVEYLIVIAEQIDSVNGQYQMVTTYIAADNTPVKSTYSKGQKSTQKGVPGNKNATVYTLVPDSGSTVATNLWVESDTTVIVLDNQLNTPKNKEKYRLTKK